jgi:hypothetical protein
MPKRLLISNQSGHLCRHLLSALEGEMAKYIRFNEKDEPYETISIPQRLIPIGAKLVECYETDFQIIVCGEPKDNDESHNCDHMGCSTLNHVLYRFNK